MGLIALLAQEDGVTISFDLSLVGLLAVIAGIVILMAPKVLNVVVALYLIAFGLITLFNFDPI